MALGRGLFDRLTGGTAPGGRAAPAVAGADRGGSGAADRPFHAPGDRQWAGSDPASRLPPAAAAKLKRLRERSAKAAVLLRDLDRRRTAAAIEKEHATLYLDKCKQSRSAGRGGRASSVSTYISGRGSPDLPPGGMEHFEEARPADDRQLEDATRRLETAVAALAEISREIAEEEAQRSRLPEAFDRWLRSIPADVKLEPHRPTGKPVKGDIAALRQRIGELREEINDVLSAPPPSSQVKATMRAQVAALAERARPNYLGAIEAGHPIKFPELHIQSQVATAAGIGISSQAMPDILGMFCWLHGAAIVARMETDIDELADDDGALSDEEKREREAEIRQTILEIERAEEDLICQSEASGAPLARRDDASPIAVLGLASGDLPGTVPMF